MLAGDKHSSLFCLYVYDEGKKFYTVDLQGDVAIYPRWKMTVKTWIQSFGLGKHFI
jgi:hypothetical protein